MPAYVIACVNDAWDQDKLVEYREGNTTPSPGTAAASPPAAAATRSSRATTRRCGS